MRRHIPIILAGIAAAAAAGCRDIAVPPTSAPAQSASFFAGPTLGVGPVAVFVLSPEGGTFVLPGGYVVNFPANAVCDPATSSYGPAYWDSACKTITRPLILTVTVVVAHGRTYADFSPSIRFSPSTTVTIGTNANARYVKSSGFGAGTHRTTLGLLFATSAGGYPVNDAVSDPTLVTHINLASGWIWRRIKHFTGYNIVTGDECDATGGDPYCVDSDAIFSD